jgi:NTP pyrophosphatase (non-canonical NTP hydrolase)
MSEPKESLSLKAYQRAAMRTANPSCIDLSNAALGLCGEAGEFADCVKKHLHQGHPLDRDKLIREAGDVLWYVALACEVLGVTMEHVAERNIEKLKLRYEHGYAHAASVGRKDSL